jgi:hypothetical protein
MSARVQARPVAKLIQTDGSVRCAKCNTVIGRDATFCKHCGSSLKQLEFAICGGCNIAMKPGVAQCGACGWSGNLSNRSSSVSVASNHSNNNNNSSSSAAASPVPSVRNSTRALTPNSNSAQWVSAVTGVSVHVYVVNVFFFC